MCIFHEEFDLKKITGIIGRDDELENRITGLKISIVGATLATALI